MKALATLIMIVCIMLTVTFACTPRETPTPVKPVAEITTPIAPKPPWQEEWDKTVAEAKKEGKLVIYTSGGTEVRGALREAFGKKFGIDIEYVSGRGPEITPKIFAERRAGLFLSDIYLGGATTHILLKNEGVFAPIKPLLFLAETLDTRAYFDDEIPFVDKEGIYIICHGPYVALMVAVNSDIVKSGEIKGYADLLDLKWKGKIAFGDPTTTGAAARFFLMTATMIMTPDFHRQLVKQDPVVTRDVRQQVEWVARGKCHIALGTYLDIVADFQKAGAPIRWVSPVEGVYLSSGASGTLSFFDRAPHPNAARVFVNWFMSKEGLTIWSQSSLSQTTRRDVPTDFLYPEGIRDPKVKYFDSNREEVLLKEVEAMKLAREIYGPLLK